MNPKERKSSTLDLIREIEGLAVKIRDWRFSAGVLRPVTKLRIVVEKLIKS